MRSLLAVAFAVVACGVAAAADEKKPEVVREIELKDAKLPAKERGMWSEPTKITNEDELKKAVGEEVAKAAKVDFKKEKLLLFRWAGSGQDKLSHTAEAKEGKTTVSFSLTPGRTKDLRQHAHLFAVPVDAECKCGK
jgi:hypothetical protein